MDLSHFFAHPVWFFCTLLLGVLLRLGRRASWHARQCHVDLYGKTAVVTGANSGIGKCVAQDLARRNARVILACRSQERGQEALLDIQRETGNRNVVLRIVDTSSMASVREFAEQILQEEKHLHILVNNAGASGLPNVITSEGLELVFATNHLGPFLLTNLLLDLMKQSSEGRIVNVSSFVHTQGTVNLKHLKGKDLQTVRTHQMYNNSKLMNILFSNELAQRLQGTGVTVNAVEPGVVSTEVMRHYNWIIRFIFKVACLLFFKSAEEGASSTIYCAVSEEVAGISGKYFTSDCMLALASAEARDTTLAAKLWEECEALTGLSDAKDK